MVLKKFMTFSIVFIFLLAFAIAIIQNADTVANEITSTTNKTNQSILNDSGVLLTLNEVPLSLSGVRNNLTYVDFDGDNDLIDISSIGNLNIHNQSYSICAYTNISSEQFFLGEGSNNDYMKIPPNFNVFLEDSSDTIFNEDFGEGFAFNEWNFFCLIFDSENDNITISLNGNSSYINFTNNLVSDYTTEFVGQAKATEFSNMSLDELIILNTSLTGTAKATELYRLTNQNENTYIPILMLHRIGNNSISSTYINTTQLTWIMDVINNSGMECITDVDYLNFTLGKTTLPEKPIMLVFDDAKKTVLEDAVPIMNNYNCKGVLSVPTQQLGSGSFMSWENVSSIYNVHNWSLASHSHNSSDYINEIIPDNWAYFMNASKQDIIGNISYTPISFVYPDNSQNSSTHSVCAEFYDFCFGGQINIRVLDSIYNLENTNLTDGSVKRIGITNDTTLSFINSQLNFSIDIDNEILLWYKLNENQGTTAYDVSGNGNNGTISGAEYQTDNINVTLTNNIDYNLTSDQFQILNSELDWTQLRLDYTFRDSLGRNTAASNFIFIIEILIALTLIISLVIFIMKLVEEKD